MKKKVLCAFFVLVAASPIYASPGIFIDNLRNTSRLSTAEIEWYLSNSTRAELTAALDHDGDGIADGTRIKVPEFIARMNVIIICKREREEERQRKSRSMIKGNNTTVTDDI